MSPEIWLLLGLFAFVMGGIVITGYVLILRPAKAGERGDSESPRPIMLGEPELPTFQNMLIQAFRLMGDAIPGSRSDSNPLRKQLSAAGYRWPSAVSIFYGIKCASALLMATITGWLAATFQDNVSNAILPIVCGIGFGYLLPDSILKGLIRSRALRLRRALPSAMDLMVLGIEAGQALDSTLLDTARGLKMTHPDLSAEMMLLHLEMRASNSRVEALRNFSDRNGELELRKFASLLIDTDRFGTSLGPALRSHAKYLRIRFRQQAQEKARKIGVKLIFPVFFLIFPSVVLVTLGPAAILIFTQLHNAFGN